MKTQVAPTTTEKELNDAVEAAVYLLSGCFPVALPTETVYGLAGWALNKDALMRVFQTKERPFINPLIVHLPSMEWLDLVCDISGADSPLVERLVSNFWPGPLTIVLPRKPVVHDLVTAGLPTVAVRMSAHPVFQKVAEYFDQPLAAPSANRFGRVSPTTSAHVRDELDGRIHLIVDGGPTTHGIESTIITVRGDNLWILRNGPIGEEELRPFATVAVAKQAPGRPTAPGQMKSHYAPRTPLQLLGPGIPVRQPLPVPWGLLSFRGDGDTANYAHVEVLSPSGDLREAATNLFAKLRALDARGLKQIVAESVPDHGLGSAILDRLRRAAHHG